MAVNKKVNMDNLKEYNIYAGLGGSFGGSKYLYTTICESLDEAEQEAYEQACEEYESYTPYTWGEALEEARSQIGSDYDTEEEVEEIAWEIYEAAREEWIVYKAVLTSEDTSIQEDSLIKGYLLEESGDSIGEVSCEGE